MSNKKHSVEQNIGKLRQAEVRLAQGRMVGTVCRELVFSEFIACPVKSMRL